MFAAVLLLISKLFNFLLRYWTKFEIRFRGSVEKFWKVDEFSRNPERVSGQFKRKPCPTQAHIHTYICIFKQDSETIRFDFMQSTYRCCMKILTEAARDDNEFSMRGVGRNAVSKWSVYRFNILKARSYAKIYPVLRIIPWFMVRLVHAVRVRVYWDNKQKTTRDGKTQRENTRDRRVMVALSERKLQTEFDPGTEY